MKKNEENKKMILSRKEFEKVCRPIETKRWNFRDFAKSSLIRYGRTN